MLEMNLSHRISEVEVKDEGEAAQEGGKSQN